MINMGYRNPCDFALNRDGEMFVYDADMEWDMGAPWYRPTRINHGVSGGRTDGGPLLRNGESIFRIPSAQQSTSAPVARPG